ncbi:MAG: DUF4145 domain-containing protein [Verrucomicrobia bacterium]|nr:DUF4145 domain-containing protein [Verrucomicrobiota bacterium]
MNDNSILVRCKSCRRDTRHLLVADAEQICDDERGGRRRVVYQLIRCKGCETLSCREVRTTVDQTGANGAPDEVTLYPPRAAGHEWLEHIRHLPGPVERVYREILGAMNAGLPLLATIGLRTLIEAVCYDARAKGKNLESLIDSLADLGVLSKAQATTLYSPRLVGNPTTHQITAPESTELTAALRIAEAILETLYVIPRLKQDLQQTSRGGPMSATRLEP